MFLWMGNDKWIIASNSCVSICSSVRSCLLKHLRAKVSAFAHGMVDSPYSLRLPLFSRTKYTTA